MDPGFLPGSRKYAQFRQDARKALIARPGSLPDRFLFWLEAEMLAKPACRGV